MTEKGALAPFFMFHRVFSMQSKHDSAAWQSGCAVPFFVALSAAWIYLYGKDLNSDFLNYHLYSGASLLEWRLGQDYFPAAISGYLNPLAQLPVYGLVMSGWPDWIVACALALLHLPNLYVIWKIAGLVSDRPAGSWPFACWAATFLAFIAPLQLTTLSDTFADPVAGVFVLAGVYLLLRASENYSRADLCLCGAMLGLGAGLKLTNLLFIPAAMLLAVWVARRARRSVIRECSVFAGGLALAFLVTNGWWALALWRHFGNPIFPLYNAIFASPDFIRADFSDRRMLHDGWWTWATLPYNMLRSGSSVYSENSVPDIRLICTLVVLAISLLYLAFRHGVKAPNTVRVTIASQNRLWLLIVYFVVSYLLWGTVSGIGRYGYALWLLLGPIFIGLLATCAPAPVMRITFCVVACVQIVVQFLNGNPAWNAQKWGGAWVNVEVPEVLREEPATYLLYGVQSNSFIIPYLHRDSRFSNFIGQYVQPIGDGMHGKMRDFLAHPVGLTRVIFETDYSPGEALRMGPSGAQRTMDAMLSGYGLRLNTGNCPVIRVRGESIPKTLDGAWYAAWNQRHVAQPPVKSILWACEAVPLSQAEYHTALAEYAKFDRIFDAIEDACGDTLAPHGIQTIRLSDGWLRNYFGTITALEIQGDNIQIHPSQTIFTFPVGKVSTWRNDEKFVCPDIRGIMKNTSIKLSRP